MASDANGNSYLLSKIHGKEIYIGSTSIPDATGYEAGTITMLSSLDRNGNYHWRKVIGGAATDPKEVKVMKDRVYMMGAVASAPGKKAYYDGDFTSQEYISSLSLTCYDTSGNFKWVVRPDSITDGTLPYKPISFDVDESGNTYLLVTMPPGSKIMGSSMSIPSTVPYKGSGFYVLKYNPSGTLLSVTMLKDFSFAKGNQAGVERFRFTLNKLTNQYYVYGTIVPNLNTDTLYIKSAMMKNAMFFATFENDGTYKWDIRDDRTTVVGGGLWGAKVDPAGNIILGGASVNDVTFNGYKFINLMSPSSASTGIAFIMKMSNTGSLIWCKCGGGFGKLSPLLGACSPAINHRFVTIGGVSGQKVYFGETKDSILVNLTGQDGWYAIVDINTGKTVRMGAARGDGFSDGITTMSFSGDDLLIGGYFEGTKLTIDSSAVSVGPAKNGTDLFVAKMSTSGLVSIEEKSANMVNIKIYPNPANDVLNIEDLQAETEVRLYSMSGQQVYSGVSAGNLHQLNVASLAPGMYVLQLRDKNGEVYSAKIIKQ